MTGIIFITVLSLVLGLFYIFSFREFPSERWQFFASIPMKKVSDSTWEGINIIWYGILTSTGFLLGIGMFMIMAASAGYGGMEIGGVTLPILLIFVPSCKLMALLVEGKKYTITVGGAVFVMMMSAPWLISGAGYLDRLNGGSGFNVMVMMSAIITGYAFGEGFGRLACISFGCCYGRPVASLSGPLRTIFSHWNFVFTGGTKKISYHDRYDNMKVVPVQAMTAVIYTITGIVSLAMFIKGMFYASFFMTLAVTQLWRFFSEFLRADYRGEGKISAYQFMSIFCIPYFIVYFLVFTPGAASVPDISRGLLFMWDPAVFLICAVLWTGSLVYTGLSNVTASEMKFYIIKENI